MSTSAWTNLEDGIKCPNGVCCGGMCVSNSAVNCGG